MTSQQRLTKTSYTCVENPGEGTPIKRGRTRVGQKFHKNSHGTKILLCKSGLKNFLPPKDTNSKIYIYPVILFWLINLKSITKAPAVYLLRLYIVRLLNPTKKIRQAPASFSYGSPLPPPSPVLKTNARLLLRTLLWLR